MSSESTQKIMVAHRIVSPMLLGIKDGSGLGNNAEEIKTASLLMDNTVIRPFQELLIDSFDKILAFNNISLNLYFTTLQPLEFTEVDSSLQDKETIEEETGVEMQKFNLKMIDGKKAYDTKEEAEKVAEEMGCGGSHEHEVEGVIYFMPCVSHEELKAPCWDGYEQIGMKNKNGKEVPNCIPINAEKNTELSKNDVQVILGSLAKTGQKMSDEYVFVAELDEDSDVSNEDFANYLIKEKPETTLSKIKKLVGLADKVSSKKDGSAYSDLDSKNGLYKIRYKYAKGMKQSGESRDFCKNMMKMSQSDIVWRIEDIDKASYLTMSM